MDSPLLFTTKNQKAHLACLAFRVFLLLADDLAHSLLQCPRYRKLVKKKKRKQLNKTIKNIYNAIYDTRVTQVNPQGNLL